MADVKRVIKSDTQAFQWDGTNTNEVMVAAGWQYKVMSDNGTQLVVGCQIESGIEEYTDCATIQIGEYLIWRATGALADSGPWAEKLAAEWTDVTP